MISSPEIALTLESGVSTKGLASDDVNAFARRTSTRRNVNWFFNNIRSSFYAFGNAAREGF